MLPTAWRYYYLRSQSHRLAQVLLWQRTIYDRTGLTLPAALWFVFLVFAAAVVAVGPALAALPAEGLLA